MRPLTNPPVSCGRLSADLHRLALVVAATLALWLPLGSMAQPGGDAVATWPFDGDLTDHSGHGNDAYAVETRFVEGRDGQALDATEVRASVPDAPSLRLAPGLRIECWVRPDGQYLGTQYLVVKDQEYMLRVDPPGEGGRFSFFVYLDGNWEPRVQAATAPQVGQWHHLVAGWDGQRLSLEVNGTLYQRERTGNPRTTHGRLQFGQFAGAIEDVRIENPAGASTAEAFWPFDGDLEDVSGHGHHGTAAGATFVPGQVGQALGSLAEPLRVPDSPALQIAPGFHLDCRVYFEEVPRGMPTIVGKEGEFMLRVDPPNEGSDLAFFVNLGGWEPRVRTQVPIRAREWYRIIVHWDGMTLSMDVNGTQTYISRRGLCRPTSSPLTIGGPGMLVDEVRIDNPRQPTVRVVHVTQERAILRAGTPEILTAVVQNLSQAVPGVSIRLEVPDTVRCLDDITHELGTLAPGATETVQWQIVADQETNDEAVIRLTAEGASSVIVRRPLVFLPPDDDEAMRKARMDPPSHGGRTWYIDSVDGDNANTGLAEAQPWKDFSKINGITLGPGDRVLLKRGSIFTEELSVSADGAPDNWAVIGAYGEGPRPIIRRNWDIGDRCVLLKDPDWLRVSSLVVCYAGKGMIAHYTEPGHSGLLIEDCIAHHIEGLYRPNAHGIPEWLDRSGARGDALSTSAGFGLSGAPAQGIVMRDCEMFQTSSGFFVVGDDIVLDRLYCHDNYVLNTSPHPFLVRIRRTYLQNSVFDAAGYHASAGTMGIMLGDPRGLIIRNCTWRNQPDSGSHDEGGIDFENSGDGCLIDHCTFQNNAGAAIEMLGLRSPQTRNVEIANSRFFTNNTALKLGPAEIFIWGRSPDPDICCSTGVVRDNGYVLLPGVEFFINEAPKTTRWELRDNTRYDTIAEADRAMPHNAAPEVDAGPDISTDATSVHLRGSVRDDRRSGPDPLRVRWEVLEAAGTVTFQDPTAAETDAAFSSPGDYLLRLVADDGELWLSDMVTVHVLQPGKAVAKAWEFNAPLDKEGWSEANLGTQFREWAHPNWSTTSHPVKYVAGGYYLVAMENSTDAHLMSADDLAVDLTGNAHITIRFQNHTPATRMRFRFTTNRAPVWQDANSKTFAVVPNDTAPRVYTVDMSDVAGWTGKLKQLRLDFSDGAELTGTCRIDYIWVGSN
ncbi:MAG: right-handed parallel beta-helix repeat-containing protein [Armatimonadetes bacterium]|nr:right-handed parallel beta-helix repeat-containing protein [Armatimonadota bacterium]